ncbi:MAG: RNase adaptor protein RapZ, partial [Gammaproteobacteria bacterium]|nr:RNase adaptor protein RapZ [Gammaproteobacteria bacterium]
MKLVIISGQSGSGKTIALHMLEDLGYRTVDNLPVSLYQSFVDNEVLNTEDGGLLAIGVDPRATKENVYALIEAINKTRERVEETLVLHLSTHPETLLKRYSETRRRHPFAAEGNTVEEAIAWETKQLQPLN